MPDEPRQGDAINAAVTVTGDVSGQVAAGKSITQTMQVGPPLTEPECEQVRLEFARLREQIAAQAPAEQHDAAVGRIEELEQAAFAEQPDLTTIQLVTRWFKRNLPALAGSVTSLVATPLVGRLVQVAGDQLVELIGGEA
jgi:hypothetical protein